jgi:hypothetical protein
MDSIEHSPTPVAQPIKPLLWSATSWATWKQCPLKLRLREEKWSYPQASADGNCLSALAVPGLVIDRLFELWLHRREFDNIEWLHTNFEMLWALVESKSRVKWLRPIERERTYAQTKRSVNVLFELLHQHQLLNKEMGIQTEFHEKIGSEIVIAGAIDLWTIRRDGTLVVVDFKNFGSYGHRSVDQLHFYAIALKRILGREPDEGGYVCFHPAYRGYRKTELRQCDRNKLMVRLARATAARRAGEFPAKYNYIACPRYCEQRFRCELFKKVQNRQT